MTRRCRTERTVHVMVEDLISATVAATGYPAAHVRQFIEASMRYMLREYGGDRLPKITRSFPVEAIVAAVKSGKPTRAVCKEFGIGKSTLYRVLLAHDVTIAH